MLPPGEKIIETKKCLISGQDFFITDKDAEFYDKISPVFAGNKYSIPSPKLCPEERTRRRFCFRNERALYHRTCSISKANLIAVYSPDKPQPIYDTKIWWGDDWSPFDFSIPFDFSKSFFSQFHTLLQKTPALAIVNAKSENSDYCNYSHNNKNCYIAVGSNTCEDVYHSYRVTNSKNLVDCYALTECEHCYECFECTRLNNSFYSLYCHNWSDLFLCYDCQWCQNCIWCSNLRNKTYYVNNKPVTPEVFQIELKKLHAIPCAKFILPLKSKSLQRDLQCINCEDCISDGISDSVQCYNCFTLKKSEYCKYSQVGTLGKNCLDINFFDDLEFQLEITNSIKSYWSLFGALIWFDRNALYSYSCFNVQDVFGCVSLKKWTHCILNTAYSVQEYETLCSKIIEHMISTGEWWEFFPHELSPFGYNETVAGEYFPMTEEEVRNKGWNWYNASASSRDIAPLRALPIAEYIERNVGYETAQKNIDTLLNWVIKCEITGKSFQIIKQELAFYIEHHLPLPTKHPDQRHNERMDLGNPRTLSERTCTECEKNIITTYAQERPDRVVCEECYRQLVY